MGRGWNGLVTGAVQVALHFGPRIHCRQRVDLGTDVQMLQIDAHLFEGLGIGQPVRIACYVRAGPRDRR